ncbi:MAG: restriction endonuclease subunit S [Chitinispirillia bacterium]|jgi:type I restriction enzyme S subunit
MKYGLSEKQFYEIVSFFKKNPAIEKAVLFGSRAMDTFKEASDVDIAIFGKETTAFTAQRLKSELEDETYLPFFFDVIAYNTISDENLKKHIGKKGVVIYRSNGDVDAGLSGWKRYILSNLVEVCSSKRIFYSDYVTNGIPFYRSKEIIEKEEGKGITNPLFISKKRFAQIKIEHGAPIKGDILISSVGHRSGIPHIVNEKYDFYFKDGNIIWFRNFCKKLNYKFLYYWLKSATGQNLLESIMIGSAQKALTISGIKTLEIFLPPLPEQKAIASVLSSLDDKIDLLHRQNKTLEAMAETLFRQWFVEEAKEDWEDGVLPDEFTFTMGQSPPGSSFNENKIGVPMFQGNADFRFRFPKNRVYTTEPKRFANKFDTLISVRAPVGEQNMAFEKCCIGRGVATFHCKHNINFYTYTYYKLRSLMREFKIFNDEGNVFGSIGKANFQQIGITLPPSSIISEYEALAKPINDKIISNSSQIVSLEKLRDTLLPKLMSGEVKIRKYYFIKKG